MMSVLRTLFFFATLIFAAQSGAQTHRDLYFIDAHSQIDHNAGGLKIVLEQMDANNVRTTLLSARGNRNWREIVDWSKEYPTRIVPLVRSKGQAYEDSTPRYFKMVRKQIATGRFSGAAEILIFHAQKGNKAPEVVVDLDDERVSVLLTESLKQDWPVVIHIEFAALNGRDRRRHMEALAALLKKHPGHPFVLIHMGQLHHQQVQALIESHPNLYFLTSHTDPESVSSARQPWVNLCTLSGARFKDSWRNLLVAHSERFVFALDNVWEEHWHDSYSRKMAYWQQALSALPANVAHLIAHGNAERLWKLKPMMH